MASRTALLERALTHASASAKASNERLEFLGDRVLGLVIAEKLHELYPDDAEGVLALKFNALVRREACAAAADDAGLADHVMLAASEAASGGRRKGAILAGVCEAVIAALYIDGGFDVARALHRALLGEGVRDLGGDMRDAKTALQEWAQGGARPARGARLQARRPRRDPITRRVSWSRCASRAGRRGRRGQFQARSRTGGRRNHARPHRQAST